MTIKDLIGTYKEKLAESKISASDVDPRIRAGTEAIVRNAVRDLPEVTRQYKDEVMKHAILIAVNGKESKEFASIAKHKFKTVTVDYYQVLNQMADSMHKRGVRDEFNNQEYYMALDEFNKIKMEYDILQLPAPRQNTDMVYGHPLNKALKALIEGNYGERLYSIVTRREIGTQALEAEFTGKFLPVVLYNYTGTFDENLLPRPLIVIEVNQKVDEKFVSDKLALVRAKLNPPKSKKKNNEENTTENTEEHTEQGE